MINYKHTKITCYLSYIVQGIINNFSPLLFVVFKESLGLSMIELSILITVNFSVQICVDLISSFTIRHWGYRCCIILAQSFCAAGLLSITVLTTIMQNSFVALIISTVIMSAGGGLLEVLVSPIFEALPRDEKSSSMNLLHSFYCWGQVAVVALSTLFFALVSIDNWRVLPLLWALAPVITLICFTFVPLRQLEGDICSNHRFSLLAKNKSFWFMIIIMLCAGAVELAMAQWASIFCEISLNIPKTLGDLVGPCAFAVFMGIGRVIFGKSKPKRIDKWISISFAGCFISYIITAFSPHPIISLFGFALCGLSVSILWPGTYIMGAEELHQGGSLMFALFAFSGDIGCVVGPDLVGIVSEATQDNNISVICSIFNGTSAEISMKIGFLIASIIPAIGFIISILLIKTRNKRHNRK